MSTLFNRSQNSIITDQLQTAKTFVARLVGLLGRQSLNGSEMLWIHECNSIHTFFMKFSIDCVFLDKQLVVCGINENVKPYRIILPRFKARSVIEMRAGSIQSHQIQLGDQLDVGH